MGVSHEIVVKMLTGLKSFLGMKASTSTWMASQCWLLVEDVTPCHEDFCIGLIGCPKTWQFAVSRADDPREQGDLALEVTHCHFHSILWSYRSASYRCDTRRWRSLGAHVETGYHSMHFEKL